MKYILIKRVNKDISEKPKSKIKLNEFESEIQASFEADWIVDEKGIDIKNPDGSEVNLGPQYGFSLKGNEELVFRSYEFYDGIAVHSKGREDVLKFIRTIAENLDANAFVV